MPKIVVALSAWLLPTVVTAASCGRGLGLPLVAACRGCWLRLSATCRGFLQISTTYLNFKNLDQSLDRFPMTKEFNELILHTKIKLN